MKFLLVLFTGILSVASLHAQDVIILKNGTILNVKVTEINASDVKYKKIGTTDTTGYSVPKSDVLALYDKTSKKINLNSASNSQVILLDNSGFKRNLFFEIGGCLNLQFVTPIYLTDQHSDRTSKITLYSTANLGYAITPRISADLEMDYQVSNYSYSTSDLTVVPYNSLSVHNTNTTISVIPNIIVTADQNKFTPYGRLGFIIETLNSMASTAESVFYTDKDIPSSSVATSYTLNNRVFIGLFGAAGSDYQLTKRISAFGEAYFKGVAAKTWNGTDYTQKLNEADLGISVGFKIVL